MEEEPPELGQVPGAQTQTAVGAAGAGMAGGVAVPLIGVDAEGLEEVLVVENEMDTMYDDKDEEKAAQKQEAFEDKLDAFQKAGKLGDYSVAGGKEASK